MNIMRKILKFVASDIVARQLREKRNPDQQMVRSGGTTGGSDGVGGRRTALQVIEDDALPLAIDQIERRFNRAAGPVGEIPPFHGSFSNSIQTGTISLYLQYLPKTRQTDN
jgi:hypothetical protein